jgi:large subunit ribosomal protein L40e
LKVYFAGNRQVSVPYSPNKTLSDAVAEAGRAAGVNVRGLGAVRGAPVSSKPRAPASMDVLLRFGNRRLKELAFYPDDEITVASRPSAVDSRCDHVVYVRSLTGKSISINVNIESTTVATLTEKIQEKEGIAAKEQRLIFEGKRLEDDHTLGEYAIKDRSTIHLVLALCGGMLHVTSGRADFDAFWQREKGMPVEVKLHNGTDMELKIQYDTTVREVKRRIAEHLLRDAAGEAQRELMALSPTADAQVMRAALARAQACIAALRVNEGAS